MTKKNVRDKGVQERRPAQKAIASTTVFAGVVCLAIGLGIILFAETAYFFFTKAGNEQLDFAPPFMKLAYDNFESRIRIHSQTNPRALGGVDPAKMGRRQKALAPLLETQMRRGAAGDRLHHGRFDLDESAAVQKRPDFADDGGAF